MKPNDLPLIERNNSLKKINFFYLIMMWLIIRMSLELSLGNYLDRVLLSYNIKYLRETLFNFVDLCVIVFYLKSILKKKELNIKCLFGSFSIPWKKIVFFSLFFLIVEVFLEMFFTISTNNSPSHNDFYFIDIIIIKPIIEEIIWRGILLNKLMEKMGTKNGILLATLIFISLHGKNGMFLILSSFYFGYIYYKTKSLYASIFSHSIHNGAVLLINIILDLNQIKIFDFFDYKQTLIILITLLIPLVIFFIKKFWSNLNGKKESIYTYNFINK